MRREIEGLETGNEEKEGDGAHVDRQHCEGDRRMQGWGRGEAENSVDGRLYV